VLYGAAAPVQGIVDAAAGDVEGDAAAYYALSEQRAAVVRLEADVDAATGRVRYAGGALVEAIAQGGGVVGGGAGARSTLADVARALARAPPRGAGGGGAERELSLGALRAAGEPLAAAAARVVRDFEGARVLSGAAGAARAAGELERVPLDFFCRCSKARFTEKLAATLSPALLDRMAAEAAEGVAADLTCAFCNARHLVSPEELAAARARAEAAG